MAITSASFVPESRKGGGAAAAASAGHGSAASGSSMHGADADYNHDTDAATVAMHESNPKTHPISGTGLPQTTGAGQGTVRKGGRGGK